MRGIHFRNSRISAEFGGIAAIRVTATGSADFSGCSFTNCSTGDSKGAIYVDGTNLYGSTFVPVALTSCNFTENRASKGRGGGAVFVIGNAKVAIAGCRFDQGANTSQGQNDVANEGSFADSIIFECPPGTTGKAVSMPKGATWSTGVLPPSKEVVHCG